MLRLHVFASGSAGNVAAIETENSVLLVDCGLPMRNISRFLANLGGKPVMAALVTHAHGDHAAFAREVGTWLKVPVWIARGSGLCGAQAEPPFVFWPDSETWFEAQSGLMVKAISVPHDAPSAHGFLIEDSADHRRLAFFVDLGEITAVVAATMEQSHCAVIDCNHDAALLKDSRYPASVIRRVASEQGHLSNQQVNAWLKAAPGGLPLHTIIAAHMSRESNKPTMLFPLEREAQRRGIRLLTTWRTPLAPVEV